MGYGYSKRSVDNNHSKIRDDLRKVLGKNAVIDTHALPKFVDLVVGYKGNNYLFEVKTDKKKKLTKDEQKIKDTWQGQYDVITTAEEAIKIMMCDNPPF